MKRIRPLLAILSLVCILLGIYFSYRASAPILPETVSQQIADNVGSLLRKLESAVQPVKESLLTNNSGRLTKVYDTDLVLISGSQMLNWTNNQHIPGIRAMQGNFKVKYLKTGSGDFLLRKWMVDDVRALVAVIPIRIHYRIQNEYLQPYFNTRILGKYQMNLIEPELDIGYPVYHEGEIIFRFNKFSVNTETSGVSRLAFYFYSAGILLLVILLYQFLSQRYRHHEPVLFLLLAAGIILLRYGMILFRFPARYVSWNVFDANFFASSEFNPSVADLLLNLLVVVVICSLLWLNLDNMLGRLSQVKISLYGRMVSIISASGILFAFLFPYVVVQTIYNNSSISLGISESLQFDSVRIAALISVLLSWVASFLFIHVCNRILLRHGFNREALIGLLAGTILFVLTNWFTGQQFTSSLILGLLYTGIITWFRLDLTLQRFRYLTFIYLFAGVMAFSADSYMAMNQMGDKRMLREQTRFASAFLLDRDDFGEYLLMEATERIKHDLFIQNRIAGPFANREAVRQKIKQVILPGYLNRYSALIHLFNSSGISMDDPSGNTIQYWQNAASAGMDTVNVPVVQFIPGIQRDLNRKFIAITPVLRGDIIQGYVVIELLQKRIIPENVYPELLVDNRFQNNFHAEEYSYASFDEDGLRFQYGSFSYNQFPLSWLAGDELFLSGIQWQGYRHLGVRDASGRSVVVSVPEPSLIIRTADLSFLLLCGLVILLLILLLIGIVDLLRHERLLLSARIQLILNLSFFIPLIIVSLITLGMTARLNQEQLSVDYIRKSRNFSREIGLQLAEVQRGDISSLLDQYTSQLVNAANVDASIFSADGRLLYTSQPMIFENQLLSPFIYPEALSRINHGERSFVLSEQVGSLRYFVAYSAILSPADGSVYGIAALPFFQSSLFLEKMQISVLANILFVFTIIFILLLVVFYWISTWLTFPLRLITNTLGKTNLTSSNQPLEWNAKDEIGLMVNEYNRMLATLGENKKQLERSQRELAWREIAQQVAHEIKNPLTPIKLTLQNLERLEIHDQQKNIKVKKAIDTVLHQVEILDGVATSFSTFAKMPEPLMKPVELVSLVNSVLDLHRDSAHIDFHPALPNVMIMADGQLLKRILSNIMLNAIQAARTDIPMHIQVELKTAGDFALITIADNGTGIPEHLKEKIFLPHFSTKQTGSGLGLAIAKQGVEQMGGKIYFETPPAGGAVFCIELPLIQ